MVCDLFVDGVNVLGFVSFTAFSIVSHHQVLCVMRYIIARDVAFLEDEAWPRLSALGAALRYSHPQKIV